MAGEPEAGTQPEPAEIDIEAVDDLPQEDVGKVLRGEIEPPRKGKPPEKDAGTKDEFDVDPKSETVPHGQFHRVNERRKAAEAETAKERQAREQAEARANTMAQRMAELLEASKPAPVKEEEPPPVPAWTEDPLAAGEYLAKRVEELEAKLGQTQQQTQEEKEAAALFRMSTADVVDYGKVRPELNDALKFLHRVGVEHYAKQGVSHPAHMEQALNNWQLEMAQQARAVGIRPARFMMMKAEEFGWQPSASGADAVNPETMNGAHERARDATGKFTAAAAAMDKREQTKQAAKSLGGSGGPSDGGEITPQQVADMSEEEFAAFKKKYGDNAMRKVMGASR